MSDPMSSVEIEDVLSSIRRLVSEDLRPTTRHAGQDGPAEPAPAANPLVLTPALRVVPEPEPWQDVEPWEDSELAEGGWTLPDLAALRRNPEARLADVAQAAPRPHRFTLTAAMAVRPAEPAAADRAPAEQGALPNPDLTEPAAEPPSPEPWAQEVDAFVPFEAEPPGQDPAGPQGQSERAMPQDRLTDLQDPDLAELAADAFLDSDLGPDGAEVTYDEDLLRDLVRDLIREELAGELGEKITRNIRKLVRAEIAQALATRALD